MTKTEARGYMWCSPGPYLRKSMLRVLAKEVSDHYLPEVFFDKLFTQADGNSTRSADEEKVLAMSLGIRMKDEEDSKVSRQGDKDEDEDEDSDDEDEEDDKAEDNDKDEEEDDDEEENDDKDDDDDEEENED